MDYLISCIEILVCVFVFFLLRKFPRFSFVAVLAVAYLVHGNFTALETPPSSIPGLNQEFMQAAIFAPGKGEHGIAVETIHIPSHKPWEMLVKVRGAGLNPSNFKLNMARLPFFRHTKKGKHVIGYDVEGTVLSVGSHSDCESFIAQQSIFGFAGGSIAEYAVVGCSRAGNSPTSLSPVEAAGLPVVALTSLEAWDRTFLVAGQSVLVIGASGGCGTFGVSIAKSMGALVTGICSTKNVATVNKLGADFVVDYKKKKDMQELIQKGQQFDIIYDTVTSFAPEDPDYEVDMRPLLKVGGKYVAINGGRMDWTRGIWEKILFKKYFNMSIQRKDYDLFLLTPTTKNLNRLAAMIDSGKVPKTIIDTVFVLSETTLNQAFSLIKTRRVVGKIVFKF